AAEERSGVAAKPQDPSAITRMPTPRLSVSPIDPTFPFFTTRLWVRRRTARASAYEASRERAVSTARAASSFTASLRSRSAKSSTRLTLDPPSGDHGVPAERLLLPSGTPRRFVSPRLAPRASDVR